MFGQIDRQTVIKNTVLSGFTGTGTKKIISTKYPLNVVLPTNSMGKDLKTLYRNR